MEEHNAACVLQASDPALYALEHQRGDSQLAVHAETDLSEYLPASKHQHVLHELGAQDAEHSRLATVRSQTLALVPPDPCNIGRSM